MTTTKPRPRAKKSKKLSELLNVSKQLAQGVTSERIAPIFFDASKLKRQPEPLYRLDTSGHRYYYRYEKEEPVFYTSVTTMIRNTMPTPPQLMDWMIKKGSIEGKSEADERALYGTFLHAEFQNMLINGGKYNLDAMEESLKSFALKENFTPKSEWLPELKKDMLALAQFCIDHNVEPLSIEICLWHPTDGYAGALDLVCNLSVEEKGFFGEVYKTGENKGNPKESKRTTRMMAIVDLKSGRHSFYETHQIQLAAYREMWNVHFPDQKVEKIFNLSPKEWRSNPGYNFTDQTDAKSVCKLKHLVELAKIEDERKNKSVTICQGQIDLTKGLDGNITEKSFAELVKSR